MKELTLFEQFRENLYDENLRGAWELEAMRYSIQARLGLSEPDALELAVRIVAAPVTDGNFQVIGRSVAGKKV